MSTETEIIEGILRNGVDILENCILDKDSADKYISKINSEHLNYPFPKIEINSNDWFMPEEYKSMDIEKHLVDICPEKNYERLILELQEYRRRNLLPLLCQMKYIIDKLRENQIVWGVGRGSSVASYVLFLLGVHKIDSVKYNLPIEEFFKGGENG